jgi:DNA repair protein RadA
MIDSPYHPYSDTRFTVNERGLDDVDEKTPRKKAGDKEEDD